MNACRCGDENPYKIVSLADSDDLATLYGQNFDISLDDRSCGRFQSTYMMAAYMTNNVYPI